MYICECCKHTSLDAPYLSCVRSIGSLTLALKLQDHPGGRYKGFLSWVTAFNLRQHRLWP